MSATSGPGPIDDNPVTHDPVLDHDLRHIPEHLHGLSRLVRLIVAAEDSDDTAAFAAAFEILHSHMTPREIVRAINTIISHRYSVNLLRDVAENPELLGGLTRLIAMEHTNP